MSSTKHEKLSSYRSNAQYLLIGDSDRKIYHRKECTFLDRLEVRKKSLLPMCYNIGRGWRPCPQCKPAAPAMREPREKEGAARPLGEQLCRIAGRYGMQAKLIGSNIYITTICDEWFFNYRASPIILHHKNTERRMDGAGRVLEGDYHRQADGFDTPFQTMMYIRNHTGSVVNREFAPSAAQLRLETGGDGSAQLLCGEIALAPGRTITALFPCGWHEVVVNIKTDGRWYIATPDFSPYSPAGLFAKVPKTDADAKAL